MSPIAACVELLAQNKKYSLFKFFAMKHILEFERFFENV